MSTIVKWVIGVLVLAALVLGYEIYKSEQSAAPVQQSGASQTAPAQDAGAQAAPTQTAPAQTASNSAPRPAVLVTPTATSTDAQKQAYFNLIVSKAVQSNTLSIGACSPTPIVLSIQKGASLKLANNDAVEHTVVFDQAHMYDIPAGASKTVTADFGKGAGIYGYGCDASSQAVGMILLTDSTAPATK